MCHRHQSHMIVTTNIISITLSIFIKGNTCYDNDKSPLTLARSYCYVIAFPCAITLHLKSCLSSHPNFPLPLFSAPTDSLPVKSQGFWPRRSNPNEWELECHTARCSAFNGAAQDIGGCSPRVGRGNREIISSERIVQTQEEESDLRHQLEVHKHAPAAQSHIC